MDGNENNNGTVSADEQQNTDAPKEPAQGQQQTQSDMTQIMNEIDTLKGEIVSLKDILGTLVTSTGPIVDKSDTITDTDNQDDGYRGLDAFDLTI